MLTVDEFTNSINMAQAVGERPYGHFDHDAMCLSGPVMKKNILIKSVPPKIEEAEEELPLQGPPKTHYKSFENPETGEILYKHIDD